uniref:Cytochrome b n=1 Tax=Beroe forskalii TaxID=140453 RepID=A0A2U8JFC7_BERFR|nr:cytochrome b [Beroe forskalii]
MFSMLPLNINYSFNYGIILLILFIFLIISGLLSVIFYNNNLDLSFFNLILNSFNSFFYFLLRFIHNNSANLFFLFIFFHIFKSWFYTQSKNFVVLILGLIIFFLACAVAFFGYCLPMGQMSFWASIVIFSLLSVLPYGLTLITYIFGSFSISSRTLSLLFLLHFITPFVLLLFVSLHLIFLHLSLSSFTSFNNYFDLITFFPLYFYIDLFVFFMFLFLYFIILFYFSMSVFETENFISFMTLVTPLHIYPDWFLLFPYACLRSVDIKWFGVVLLIIVLFFMIFAPFLRYFFKSSVYMYFFHAFLISFLLLFTFVGANPPVYPYSLLIIIFQILFYLFFFFYLIFLLFLYFF